MIPLIYVHSAHIWSSRLLFLLLHIGERSQLKVFMSQGNINITDSMGRTPLMYAVIGKQAKVCATYTTISISYCDGHEYV